MLASYGTGAIMAVPAHDLRDCEFAQRFDLPIRPVVQPPEDYQPSKEEAALAYEENGQRPIRSPARAPPSTPARSTACRRRSSSRRSPPGWRRRGLGCRKVNYKLRDWLFSRQRYWGEPFPILHEVDDKGKPTGVIEPLSPDELPLRLPELEDYKPSGKPEPPLGKATDWLYVTRNGKRYRRETNTMPQWAGSCWYYLRYLDPKNDKAFCDPEKEKYWMPVDLYVGGAEHAVLHLLYSRFWHKVLFDRGHVHDAGAVPAAGQPGHDPGRDGVHSSRGLHTHKAALSRLGVQAERVKVDEDEVYILGKPGTNPVNAPLTEEQVEKKGELRPQGRTGHRAVDARAYKMSKSRGNVINPDDVVDEYGADSLRLYEMFMGPLEATKPWSMRGVEGVYRFLGRVWRLFIDDRAEEMRLADAVQRRRAGPRHAAAAAPHHPEGDRTTWTACSFNTAIAAMMELTNHLTPAGGPAAGGAGDVRAAAEPRSRRTSPRSCGTALGHKQTLAYEPWPKFDPGLLKADDDRGAGADQRQAATQADGAGGHRRQGPGSDRPGR